MQPRRCTSLHASESRRSKPRRQVGGRCNLHPVQRGRPRAGGFEISIPCRGISSPCRGIDFQCRGFSITRRGIDFPCRGFSIPCRGFSIPCRGISISCRGIDFPCRGFSIPRRGIDFPCRGFSIPSRGISISCRGFWNPRRGIDWPCRGISIPCRENAIPRRGNARPADGNALARLRIRLGVFSAPTLIRATGASRCVRTALIRPTLRKSGRLAPNARVLARAVSTKSSDTARTDPVGAALDGASQGSPP